MKKIILIFIFFPIALINANAESNVTKEDIGSLYDSALIESENYIQYETKEKITNTEEDIYPDGIPTLEGKWLFKKQIIRRIPTKIIVPTRGIFCDSRFPEPHDDFKREVVISSEGKDYFAIRSLEPINYQEYKNDVYNTKEDYENFGFKASIDPENLTFAYTEKLKDFKENPKQARQVWFSGKLFYETATPVLITGRGYELVSTPECQGFYRDEVKFQLIKMPGFDLKKDGILAGLPHDKNPNIPKQAGDFNPYNPEENKDITDLIDKNGKSYFSNLPKNGNFDSAKPKSNLINATSQYKSEEGKSSKTAGMW